MSDHPSRGADVDEVLAANRALYDAFEARDIVAMEALWAGDPEVLVTHPGWPTLHGVDQVMTSWRRLLSNAQHLQFIVTNTRVVLAGEASWVTCDENILGDGASGGTVAALNLFRRRPDGTWQCVGHHGSPVAG
jgi:ketosteroid isomerase-like protein